MLRFWIKERVFSVVKYCLSPLIQFEIEFDEGVSIKNLTKPDIYYALPENSIIDLIALEIFTNSIKVTSPLGELNKKNLQNFICLSRPTFDPIEQKIKRKLPENLSNIIIQKSIETAFLPVSFYWGMHPEKQKSLFKIIFSQSWGPSGPIKKFFRLLFHGRSLLIKFNNPIYLDRLNDEERSVEENSQLINRYIRGLFRENKRAAIGPDISHRRTLVKSLTQDKEVREEINRETGTTPKKKNKYKKKAFKYANEICSDISYPIVRLLQRGLGWFWNNRYESISVKNIERIKSIANTNSLIYVPCHRSHIDYLILSYILLEKGLMLPHIAAGNNLNLPFLGKILRGGGAFFMRRSFVKNKLYSIIFFQYLKRLMLRGSSIEFFPEGSRSRSGLSLPSRPGLLSMTLRSFAGLKIDNVKIVPTYIGYEKIIEGKSYLSELLGKEKKRESILDIFNSIRDFKNFQGNAFLNFGKPIDLKIFLDKELNGKNFHIDSSLERPQWLRAATSNLGFEIMKSINASSAVTSTSIFSLTLLTSETLSLDSKVTGSRIQLLLNLLKDNNLFKDVWITSINSKKIIQKTENLGLISSQFIGGSKVFRPDRNEAALLGYYKNNIVHLFMFYSMICLSLKLVEKLSKKEILKLILSVYPLLKRNYHLIWHEKEIEEVLEKSLDTITKLGLVKKNSSDIFVRPKRTEKNYENFIAVSNISESSIKSIFIVIKTLIEKKSVASDTLQDLCIEISKKLQKIEGWVYNEFFELDKFSIHLENMVKEGYIKRDDFKNLVPTKIALQAGKNLESIFHKEFKQLVS